MISTEDKRITYMLDERRAYRATLLDDLEKLAREKQELPGGTPEDKRLTYRLMGVIKKLQSIERDIYILSGNAGGNPKTYVPAPIPTPIATEDDKVYIYHKGKKIGVLNTDSLDDKEVVKQDQPTPQAWKDEKSIWDSERQALIPQTDINIRRLPKPPQKHKRAAPSVIQNAWDHRDEIMGKWKSGLSHDALSYQYGVSKTTIHRIINNIQSQMMEGQRPATNEKPLPPNAPKEVVELYNAVMRIRERYGLYQQDIAHALGVDTADFSKAIHGVKSNARITMSTLWELEKKLKVEQSRKGQQ